MLAVTVSGFHHETAAGDATGYSSVGYAHKWTPVRRTAATAANA